MDGFDKLKLLVGVRREVVKTTLTIFFRNNYELTGDSLLL